MQSILTEHDFNKKNKPLAFWMLVFFTLILYLSPQSYLSFLEPLHLAKTSALLAFLSFVLTKVPGTGIGINTCEKSIIMLAIFAVMSIPLSSWPGGSYEYFTEIFLKVIIIFFLMSRLTASLDRMNIIISILIWCTAYFAVVALWNYSHQIYFRGGRIGGPEGGMARDPNDLALCLVLMIPFVLSRYQMAKGISGRLFHIVVLLLLISGTIVSFSRGGFIGLMVVLGLNVLRLPGNKRTSAIFGLSILLVLFVIMSPGGYFNRMNTIVNHEQDEQGSAQLRLEDMTYALHGAIMNPILGAGIGMNQLAMQEAGKKGYSPGVHSAPLQIASELGFIALGLYIYLFYSGIKNMKYIQTMQFNSDDNDEIHTYAKAIEISMWGFVIMGFLLPVAYRWYSYYILGLASALYNMSLNVQKH